MRADFWLSGQYMLGKGFLEKTHPQGHHAIALLVSVNQNFAIKIGSAAWQRASLVLLDTLVDYETRQEEDWQIFAYIPGNSSLGILLKEKLQGKTHWLLERQGETPKWLASFSSDDFHHWQTEELFLEILLKVFQIQSFPLEWSGDLRNLQRSIKESTWEHFGLGDISKNLELNQEELEKQFHRLTGFYLKQYLVHLRIARAFELCLRGVDLERACKEAGLPSFSTARQYVRFHFQLDLKSLLLEHPTIRFKEGNLWNLWGFKQLGVS